MTTDALYRNEDPKRTSAVDSAEEDSNESLMEMSPSELNLMQEITLHQMREAPAGAELLVLGRVWYRLERERRRRTAEVTMLERMYFAR